MKKLVNTTGGEFKISYNNLKKNRLEYVILNENKFDITYKSNRRASIIGRKG